MAGRFTEEIDGEGVAWAAAGFVATPLIGVVIEPFRGTVGLENVALGYLLVVVVTAAVGGRAAGLISATERRGRHPGRHHPPPQHDHRRGRHW